MTDPRRPATEERRTLRAVQIVVLVLLIGLVAFALR